MGKKIVRNVQYGLGSWPPRPLGTYWMCSQLSIIFQLTLQRVPKQLLHTKV